MSALNSSYVGSLRLLYLIRAGRFTQVWAAIDDSLQRRVCVKLLLPEFRRDRRQRRMFRDEYEVGRTLQHPLLLGARELGESKQGPYLLMELFTSRNLREVMHECREAALPWLPAIAVQIAEAMTSLHSLRWLHLDLKPENVLLNEHGEVRLIDFSLARRVPNRLERFLWRRTGDVAIRGTCSYLAPELIRREPPDERTDVYALGCTLYHLAANTPPYVGGSSNELLKQHLHGRVPNLRVDNPETTPEFANLIAAMMRKNPTDRPQTTAAVLEELRSTRMFAWQDQETARPLAVTKN